MSEKNHAGDTQQFKAEMKIAMKIGLWAVGLITSVGVLVTASGITWICWQALVTRDTSISNASRLTDVEAKQLVDETRQATDEENIRNLQISFMWQTNDTFWIKEHIRQMEKRQTNYLMSLTAPEHFYVFQPATNYPDIP